MRCLLGGQDEGLQMTKDEALKLALEALENIDRWLPTIGQKGLRDYEADAIQAIKAALKGQDEPVLTDQAHLFHITIQSAVNIERENCARLCDAYEFPDLAQAIRARGHR